MTTFRLQKLQPVSITVLSRTFKFKLSDPDDDMKPISLELNCFVFNFSFQINYQFHKKCKQHYYVPCICFQLGFPW